MCTKWASESGDRDINGAFMEDYDNTYKHFGTQGRRVIGLCMQEFEAPTNVVFQTETQNYPTTGHTFLGVVAIMDPPRDEAPHAIQSCKRAGIKV